MVIEPIWLLDIQVIKYPDLLQVAAIKKLAEPVNIVPPETRVQNTDFLN